MRMAAPVMKPLTWAWLRKLVTQPAKGTREPRVWLIGKNACSDETSSTVSQQAGDPACRMTHGNKQAEQAECAHRVHSRGRHAQQPAVQQTRHCHRFGRWCHRLATHPCAAGPRQCRSSRPQKPPAHRASGQWRCASQPSARPAPGPASHAGQGCVQRTAIMSSMAKRGPTVPAPPRDCTASAGLVGGSTRTEQPAS